MNAFIYVRLGAHRKEPEISFLMNGNRSTWGLFFFISVQYESRSPYSLSVKTHLHTCPLTGCSWKMQDFLFVSLTDCDSLCDQQVVHRLQVLLQSLITKCEEGQTSVGLRSCHQLDQS